MIPKRDTAHHALDKITRITPTLRSLVVNLADDGTRTDQPAMRALGPVQPWEVVG
jgi:hypothetical protein